MLFRRYSFPAIVQGSRVIVAKMIVTCLPARPAPALTARSGVSVDALHKDVAASNPKGVRPLASTELL